MRKSSSGGTASTPARATLLICLTTLAVGAAACSVPMAPARQVDEPHSQRRYVLTGLPAPDGYVPKPILTVKIDNTTQGQPQRGVNSADLVIEEPVEGGLTRLAAFFESRLPETVGPVRSARISDIGMVKPVTATVIASGSAEKTAAAFSAAGVPMIADPDPAFTRDPDRPMPFDLFVDLTRVNRSRAGTAPRQPYFEFGQPKLPTAREVEKVTIVYSPSHREDWRWEGQTGMWVRADVGDATIATPTIIVASVKLADAGYRDAAGSRVPIVETTGSGNAFLLTAGRAHPIAWQKDAPTAQWQFSTRAGLVIPVPVGKVWLALIQRGSGRVLF